MFIKFKKNFAKKSNYEEHMTIPRQVNSSTITEIEKNKKLDIFKKILFADVSAIFGTILITTNMILGTIILGPSIVSLVAFGIINLSTDTCQNL